MKLNFAIARLERAGIGYDYDEFQGAFGILDKGNWIVCGTDPQVGSPLNGQKVWVVVEHYNC